ncbi:unnamed protein product [Rotaria sp. Silwood2]|nr:unnamed protein product [Rotaria sp. Silwood2]
MGSCSSVKKVDKKIQASPEDDYSVVPITPPPPPPKRNATKSINGETIDITSLDRIVQAADFSVIVNENIQINPKLFRDLFFFRFDRTFTNLSDEKIRKT